MLVRQLCARAHSQQAAVGEVHSNAARGIPFWAQAEATGSPQADAGDLGIVPRCVVIVRVPAHAVTPVQVVVEQHTIERLVEIQSQLFGDTLEVLGQGPRRMVHT